MKKYRHTILQVFVLSSLLVGSAIAFAFNGPQANPPDKNTPPPINQNGYGQYIGVKEGTRDYAISGVSLAVLGSDEVFDDVNFNGIRDTNETIIKPEVLGSASSQFLTVTGTRADIVGTVTVSNLAGTGERPVCIGQDHKLKICENAPAVPSNNTNNNSNCYPLVYPEISTNPNDVHYQNSQCNTYTTQTTCNNTDVWLRNRTNNQANYSFPVLGSSTAADITYGDMYITNAAHSHAITSHLLLNPADLDYEGDTLPKSNPQNNEQLLGPKCVWSSV